MRMVGRLEAVADTEGEKGTSWFPSTIAVGINREGKEATSDQGERCPRNSGPGVQWPERASETEARFSFVLPRRGLFLPARILFSNRACPAFSSLTPDLTGVLPSQSQPVSGSVVPSSRILLSLSCA